MFGDTKWPLLRKSCLRFDFGSWQKDAFWQCSKKLNSIDGIRRVIIESFISPWEPICCTFIPEQFKIHQFIAEFWTQSFLWWLNRTYVTYILQNNEFWVICAHIITCVSTTKFLCDRNFCNRSKIEHGSKSKVSLMGTFKIISSLLWNTLSVFLSTFLIGNQFYVSYSADFNRPHYFNIKQWI